MRGASAVAETVEAYLAALKPDQRAALQKIRRAIHAAAPGAVECISYGIPAIRLHGRVLLHFGAARDHCSLYPGAAPIRLHAEDLKGYRLGKGTVRFAPEAPLPATLVRMLVKTRIAEHAAHAVTRFTTGAARPPSRARKPARPGAAKRGGR
jgi:uncharacterized protein YdhG (YjbR/CyaY superfamily)